MTAPKGGFWNLSNKLTLFRIGAIPIVVLLLLFFPGRWPNFIAAFIFFLAALSDGLDGYLARRGNMVSNVGKLLDPLADKLLVCIALIMLIPLGRVSAWIVAVIIGRELVVTTLRGVSAADGVVIAANWSGKLKAFTQLTATNLLILHYPYFSLDIHLIGTIMIWIALVLTVWSGLDFIFRYRTMP
jgi:CDP-diacylglycerol--glycerol-3-phosphate 3-phosphatidyltransferase